MTNIFEGHHQMLVERKSRISNNMVIWWRKECSITVLHFSKHCAWLEDTAIMCWPRETSLNEWKLFSSSADCHEIDTMSLISVDVICLCITGGLDGNVASIHSSNHSRNSTQHEEFIRNLLLFFSSWPHNNMFSSFTQYIDYSLYTLKNCCLGNSKQFRYLPVRRLCAEIPQGKVQWLPRSQIKAGTRRWFTISLVDDLQSPGKWISCQPKMTEEIKVTWPPEVQRTPPALDGAPWKKKKKKKE